VTSRWGTPDQLPNEEFPSLTHGKRAKAKDAGLASLEDARVVRFCARVPATSAFAVTPFHCPRSRIYCLHSRLYKCGASVHLTSDLLPYTSQPARRIESSSQPPSCSEGKRVSRSASLHCQVVSAESRGMLDGSCQLQAHPRVQAANITIASRCVSRHVYRRVVGLR
jgi:hypothetical protein